MIGIQMAPTARRIVETVLAVKPGENVCIVTDTECPHTITESLPRRPGARAPRWPW